LRRTPNTAALVVAVVDQTGAVVSDARVRVINRENRRNARCRRRVRTGVATIGALPLTGTYTINVSKAGFTADDVTDLTLRAQETATVKVTLVATGGKTEVVVYGTTQACVPTRRSACGSIPRRSTRRRFSAARSTTLPLFNSAFRQGKGTGDLFVNATYFITAAAAGAPRPSCSTAPATTKAGAARRCWPPCRSARSRNSRCLTNAFSAEFGWTAGPAMNIVTKSGTNTCTAKALHGTAGGMQARTFSTKGFLRARGLDLRPRRQRSWRSIPAGHARRAQSIFGVGRRAAREGQDLLFATGDYTLQDRTTFLSPTLPSFVLPADGHLDYEGHYRQALAQVRVDHRFSATQSLMGASTSTSSTTPIPNDAVAGTSAPSVARKYSRQSITGQVNLTSILGSQIVNEARVAYLNGDPVTLWEADVLSTTYTRAGSVPFTIGQSRVSDLFGRQAQFSDTLSWNKGKHTVRLGTSIVHHTSGGTGNEPGFAISAPSVPQHVDGAVRISDSADVQQYCAADSATASRVMS
jgi:hypothetical protein